MSTNVYLPPTGAPLLEWSAIAEGLAAKRRAICRIEQLVRCKAWLAALAKPHDLQRFLERYAEQLDAFLDAFDAGAETWRLQKIFDLLQPFHAQLPELGPLLAGDIEDDEEDARCVLSGRVFVIDA